MRFTQVSQTAAGTLSRPSPLSILFDILDIFFFLKKRENDWQRQCISYQLCRQLSRCHFDLVQNRLTRRHTVHQRALELSFSTWPFVTSSATRWRNTERVPDSITQINTIRQSAGSAIKRHSQPSDRQCFQMQEAISSPKDQNAQSCNFFLILFHFFWGCTRLVEKIK